MVSIGTVCTTIKLVGNAYRYERVCEAERRGGEIVVDRRVHRGVVPVPVTRFLRVQIQTVHQFITWNDRKKCNQTSVSSSAVRLSRAYKPRKNYN